jgi:transcriptional regulator with XRE-family HTH domain
MDAVIDLSFGELLRRYRHSASLTQEDLAARAGLTPQAIGLLERGERRRPHRYTVGKLVEALKLTDPERARFESAARNSSARFATVRPSQDNLPIPLTHLIGRDEEVMTVVCLLHREEVRLLTLTGPGGVGKTRLAVAVAERSREAFADGVVFVPLASLRDAALLPSVLAETLGIKEVAG